MIGFRKPLLAAAVLTLLLGLAVDARPCSVITFEWTEGTNSTHVSRHGTTGPVLADDFVPARSGWVCGVEWWGSAPLSTGGIDQWEVTFHNDTIDPRVGNHEPAYTAPSGGISQHFVAAAGSDPDGDGVWHYQAAWIPEDVFIDAGTTYWFSVANASGNGWTWANPGPLAPTVGSENWGAVVSVGGDPSMRSGPHDGPWSVIFNPDQSLQDFAFRIWVPEPATFGLFGLGLLGLGLVLRRRR